MERTGPVPPEWLSPAARMHREELLMEVGALVPVCRTLLGKDAALDFFLLSYDEIMSRCPAHARDVVEARFLAVAQALKLAPRVTDGLSPSQRRIDLR